MFRHSHKFEDNLTANVVLNLRSFHMKRFLSMFDDLFETPVSDIVDFDVPAWMPEDITVSDVIHIVEFGAMSTCFHDVIYPHAACKIVDEHEHEIRGYIYDYGFDPANIEFEDINEYSCKLLDAGYSAFGSMCIMALKNAIEEMMDQCEEVYDKIGELV